MSKFGPVESFEPHGLRSPGIALLSLSGVVRLYRCRSEEDRLVVSLRVWWVFLLFLSKFGFPYALVLTCKSQPSV